MMGYAAYCASYRQTRQRFSNPRLPFMKAVSSLFPNDNYAKFAIGFVSRARGCYGSFCRGAP